MRSMRVSNPRMREIQTEMEQSDIVRLNKYMAYLYTNQQQLYVKRVDHCNTGSPHLLTEASS